MSWFRAEPVSMRSQPPPAGPSAVPTRRNSATSGTRSFCATRAVSVPASRITPKASSTCLASSTDSFGFKVVPPSLAASLIEGPGRRAPVDLHVPEQPREQHLELLQVRVPHVDQRLEQHGPHGRGRAPQQGRAGGRHEQPRYALVAAAALAPEETGAGELLEQVARRRLVDGERPGDVGDAGAGRPAQLPQRPDVHAADPALVSDPAEVPLGGVGRLPELHQDAQRRVPVAARRPGPRRPLLGATHHRPPRKPGPSALWTPRRRLRYICINVLYKINPRLNPRGDEKHEHRSP